MIPDTSRRHASSPKTRRLNANNGQADSRRSMKENTRLVPAASGRASRRASNTTPTERTKPARSQDPISKGLKRIYPSEGEESDGFDIAKTGSPHRKRRRDSVTALATVNVELTTPQDQPCLGTAQDLVQNEQYPSVHGVRLSKSAFIDFDRIKKAVINEAKKGFRKHIALQNCFPDRDNHLHIASSCISEVIKDWTAKGFIPDGAISQTHEMDVIVFEEATAYLGILKDLCVQHVKFYYEEAIDPLEVFEGNQQGQLDLVASKIKELLSEETSKFHLGGIDEQGKFNNMMHPCIRQVCVDFYYGSGSDALASQCPDTFQDSIPEHAIAVVATCIYNALDEYSMGEYIPITFTSASYDSEYKGILDLIEVIKMDPYHKAKWDKCRREWAHAGMDIINPTVECLPKRFRAYLE